MVELVEKDPVLCKNGQKLELRRAKLLLQILLDLARNQAKTLKNHMECECVFLDMVNKPN